MNKSQPKQSGNNNNDDFEKSLEELEKVVKKLESGELPLNKCLELFELGIDRYKECKKFIEKAEKRISKLTNALKEENL